MLRVRISGALGWDGAVEGWLRQGVETLTPSRRHGSFPKLLQVGDNCTQFGPLLTIGNMSEQMVYSRETKPTCLSCRF